MNRNNGNITLNGSQKGVMSGQKPPTPAIQGVASSHGVKLSLNMTSNDKKKLLTQLEEWRKSKREKIAAAMLAKQKQAEKPKMTLPVLPIKSKPVSLKNSGGQERLSVFERLYKNEKGKKPETQISKENSSVATKSVPHLVVDQVKITGSQSASQQTHSSKENPSEATKSVSHPVVDIKITDTQPDPQPVTDQINNVEQKPSHQNKKQDENAEIMPFPQPFDVQTIIGETKSASPESSDQNENTETKQAINHEIKISETDVASDPINLDIKLPETNFVIQSFQEETKISESDVASNPIDPEIKLLKTSPLTEEFQQEIKIANKNPFSQHFNDQNKDVNKTFAPHTISGQMKSAKPVPLPRNGPIKGIDSKPVKSVLAKSSLPVRRVETGNAKIILRRSLSMMFHQKRQEQNNLRRSMSTQNLPKLKPQKLDHKTSQMLPPLPPVRETPLKNKVSVKPTEFVTPKSIKPLTSTHLRTKLEDWLKVKGHPLEGYRHLRCFGISDNENHASATASKTEEHLACEISEHSVHETTPNTPLDDSNKENVTPPTVIRRVTMQEVENWLKELHRLVVELKYPAERCEEWLAAIRKKSTQCTQLPIYWECLAALDESKGDIKSAIADYETAIIKGGEVETVGDSLAQLFDKMVIESERRSKPKLEKGIDPRNIFKSTIIKFALQQKALKDLSSELEPGLRKQLYVATPVRRSTRIQTPSKLNDEVASLQTLTPEVRKNVTFKLNQSLLTD